MFLCSHYVSKRLTIQYTDHADELSRTRSTPASDVTLLSQHNRSRGSTLHKLSRRLYDSYPISALRYWLYTPLVASVTIGRACLMLFYFGALLFAALYRTNIFVNPGRASGIAVSQLPFLFALATKNSVIGLFLSVGYERLSFFHRYMGRLVVLAANVHAIGFIYKWTQAGTFTQHIQPAEIRWGLVALVSFDILFFFSLSVFRQKVYQFFYATHFVALIVALIAIGNHRVEYLPYVIIAAALYVADRILRIVRSRISTAHIETIPEIGTTLVRITRPRLNAGWRPGQHVRVRVLSFKLGWLGWVDVHPYTIASAPLAPYIAAHFSSDPTSPAATPDVNGNDYGELVLMIKKSGDWTHKLYDIAKTSPSEKSLGGSGTDIKMIVEGPYGNNACVPLTSFSGAMIVVGGSGISFALSAIQDLLQNASPVQSGGMSTIELVWCVRSARAVKPLIPVFKYLLSQSNDEALMPLNDTTSEDTQTQTDEPFFPPGLSLQPGRPKLSHLLEEVIDRTTARLPDEKAGDSGEGRQKTFSDANGVVLAVCGPGALAEDCRRAVGSIERWKKEAVGSVELVEE
ncbi:hypothetical protein K474DRAFT_1588111 [Panus rudis PR-1116 ss-1]|nr:hypothetical protein K474DRAFT_1588111 [Panus rudis PR-1116 ss-1]